MSFSAYKVFGKLKKRFETAILAPCRYRPPHNSWDSVFDCLNYIQSDLLMAGQWKDYKMRESSYDFIEKQLIRVLDPKRWPQISHDQWAEAAVILNEECLFQSIVSNITNSLPGGQSLIITDSKKGYRRISLSLPEETEFRIKVLPKLHKIDVESNKIGKVSSDRPDAEVFWYLPEIHARLAKYGARALSENGKKRVFVYFDNAEAAVIMRLSL